ncbi:MAG TPA: hypothetical protein VIU93_15165 [Gallionellaceae bacterium]
MEITCYRDQELAREARTLPAATYNLVQTLLARCPNGSLFVPIRSMQYLAIADAEEIVFLDGMRKCWVDIAWRHFHPQARTALNEPVAYDACYYTPEAAQQMNRLQGEFSRALQALAAKEHFDGDARVIKFPARTPSSD